MADFFVDFNLISHEAQIKSFHDLKFLYDRIKLSIDDLEQGRNDQFDKKQIVHHYPLSKRLKELSFEDNLTNRIVNFCRRQNVFVEMLFKIMPIMKQKDKFQKDLITLENRLLEMKRVGCKNIIVSLDRGVQFELSSLYIHQLLFENIKNRTNRIKFEIDRILNIFNQEVSWANDIPWDRLNTNKFLKHTRILVVQELLKQIPEIESLQNMNPTQKEYLIGHILCCSGFRNENTKPSAKKEKFNEGLRALSRNLL